MRNASAALSPQRTRRTQRAHSYRILPLCPLCPLWLVVGAVLMTILFLAPAVRAQAPAPAPQAAAPAGNAENGKRVFTGYYCYACHGTAGQGGSAGARIAPRPIAFAAFLRYVRKPTGQMPPYTSKVISEQDLADIYAFLRSVPVPPAAASIPLLNQ